MRIPLLAVTIFISLTTAAAAQAPEAAAPTPATKTNVVKSTKKTPAMVLRARKTTASREVPDLYKGRVLTVGSGGGIRGKETAYSLLDDGRLFKKLPGDKTYTIIGKQTPAITKKVFWSVEDRCAIKKTTYNKPGNLYRFVGWRKGAETHKVTWAPGDKDVPANYNQVYTGFLGMIPPDKK